MAAENRQNLVFVDVIIEKGGRVVLIRRGIEPFKGKMAFPGGFLDYGERVEDAAVREAKEETGLDVRLTDIVGVHSGSDRDPRGASLSIIFAAEPVGGEMAHGDDADRVEWVDVSNLEGMDLTFDHRKMATEYIGWKKDGKTYWSTK